LEQKNGDIYIAHGKKVRILLDGYSKLDFGIM